MALSEKIKNTINSIRGQFPTEQALLLPLLHEIQNDHGWVSRESMKDAAEFLNLPIAKVREVASFYTMYKLEPQGKVDIQVCTNLSCWLMGSDKLIETAEKRYGCKLGETTADGKFTISEVQCLASCGTAPVVQLNQDYYENVTAPMLTDLLAQAENDLAKGNEVGKSTHRQGAWP